MEQPTEFRCLGCGAEITRDRRQDEAPPACHLCGGMTERIENCPQCDRELEWDRLPSGSYVRESVYGRKGICGDCRGMPRSAGAALHALQSARAEGRR